MMMLMTPEPPTRNRLADNEFSAQRLERGKQNFAIMLARWVEANGWTYARLCNAVKSMLGPHWLHPSQVSSLRLRKLEGPSPKIFASLWEVNQMLRRWHEYGERPAGPIAPEFYENAELWLNDDGQPVTLDDLLRLFLGYWEPAALQTLYIAPEKSVDVNRALGRLLKTCFVTRGLDITEAAHWDLFGDSYKMTEGADIKRLRLVCVGLEDFYFSADELLLEIPQVRRALQQFTGDAWPISDLLDRLGITHGASHARYKRDIPEEVPCIQEEE